MNKSFSKYLIRTLLIVESIFLTLILGILYGILSNTIEHDFNKSLTIQQTELSMDMQDRFNYIETKLRHLSSNNSLRVSLLLDMEGQIKELIEQKYPNRNGALFFVKNEKSDKFIPSLPKHLQPFKDEIELFTKTKNLKKINFHKFGKNLYAAVLSTPIMKKNNILGTACVIYDLSKDNYFCKRFSHKGVTEILIKDGDNLINLLNGEVKPFPDLSNQNFTQSAQYSLPDFILIQLKNFPDIYYSAPSLPLKQKKINLIFILMGLYFFIFFLTIILALLISRNVCNPLQVMVDQALKIAKNPTSSSTLNEDIKYIEFRKLAHSFNHVLSNLFKAQKKLKKHRDNLEETVNKRTSELIESNKQLQKEIKEKLRAEKVIKESEKKYRSLFENNRDGIVLVNMDRYIKEANQAFLDMLGYTINEIKSISFKELTPSKWAEKDQDFIKNQILKHGYANEYEKEFIKKDGTKFPVMVNAWLLKDKNGNPLHIQAHIRDMTERNKMESELLKTRKLESLGILAGGIAHDFNNLLTAILGNISLAMFDLQAGNHDIDDILKNAETAALHAKDLSYQLLTFSKGGVPIKKTTSIVEIIKESTRFTLKGSNVNCEFNINEKIYPSDVDQGQISQVINNLIINAIQAMPQGGTITITCENIDVDSSFNVNLKEGSYTKISIADQGLGISKDNIEKVFDPYFTTKETGSGLGLASCYSIINKHDGYISLESTIDVGTTFHIYLPSSKKKQITKKSKKENIITGNGKILVMDDEQIVREILGKILQYLGYEPFFAKNGNEAISLYTQSLKSGECFDAVIMDLTIPGGMGGDEVIKKLLKIHPEVQAIVSSGYSNDPIMSNYTKYGFKGIAKKPVNIKELSVTLNNIIHSN